MTAEPGAAAQAAGHQAGPRVVVLAHGLGLVGEVSELAVEAGAGPVRVVTAVTLEAACARLAEAATLAAFVDLGLPESGGLTGLVRLQAAAPAVPIVPVLGRLEPEGSRGKAWRHDRASLVACLRNAARHQEGDRRLYALATHDPLTGLANRYLLEERLERALARARRTGAAGAVVFVDLDGFKEVNDLHGHEVGDRVLIAAAARLRGAVRATDTVARYGGDEFVLVLEDMEEMVGPSLPALVEDLRARLAQPVPVAAAGGDGTEAGGGIATVTVRGSVGAVVFPAEGDEVAVLLRRADRRMYRAKAAARRAGGRPLVRAAAGG